MRFPEFEEEWREVRFSEIGEFFKGAGISKEQLSEDGNPCILYGELYTRYNQEVIKTIVSKTNIDTKGLVKSKANDVIIPSSGESAKDIATACCVNLNDVLLGGDLNVIRPYRDNGNFISYQLNGKRKLDIAKIAQGSSVIHLYNKSLKSLELCLPDNIEEQNKITVLLSAIDTRIETQNKIIEQLKTLIKQLSNKIFSQEIKFKDSDAQNYPDWLSKNIGDVLTIGSGKDYKHLKPGDIPVFGTGGLMTYVDSFLYNGETVCIGRKGTIDKPMYHNGKIWTVDTLFFSHSFLQVVPKFIFYLFKTINWKEFNEASGVPSLSKNTIERIQVEIPSIPEQLKIEKLLSIIDDKIIIEEKLLQNYKRQKHHLLQRMFI